MVRSGSPLSALGALLLCLQPVAAETRVRIATYNIENLQTEVHHAKSRFGGRHTTDPRREGAARRLVHKLERAYHDEPYVLVGDFNDSPDDRSLNILEAGLPEMPGTGMTAPMQQRRESCSTPSRKTQHRRRVNCSTSTILHSFASTG